MSQWINKTANVIRIDIIYSDSIDEQVKVLEVRFKESSSVSIASLEAIKYTVMDTVYSKSITGYVSELVSRARMVNITNEYVCVI